MQSNETLHLWAFLTDRNNNRLTNQEVIFYKIKDGVETQIGSSVTNSYGIAYYNYVGVGAGGISFRAEYGSFQSKPYSVLDAMFYDSCVTGTTTEWWLENSPTVSVGDDGTTVSSTTTGNKFIWAKTPNTSASSRSDVIDFAPSFNIEFKVLEYTGTIYLSIGDGVSTDRNRTFGQFGITTNNHMKIEVRSDSIKFYRDDIELTSIAYTNITQATSRVGLFVNGVGSFKFKEFKIYPV